MFLQIVFRNDFRVFAGQIEAVAAVQLADGLDTVFCIDGAECDNLILLATVQVTDSHRVERSLRT